MFIYAFGSNFSYAKNILVSDNNLIIIDGDTLKIGKKKIRLHGIDTPEINQKCKRSSGQLYSCGIDAKNSLIDLISNKDILCILKNKDYYQRFIATCFVNEININNYLVLEGWALAYRKYSNKYVNAETEAKINRKGLWEGSFILPWEWRKMKD